MEKGTFVTKILGKFTFKIIYVSKYILNFKRAVHNSI